MPLRNSSSSDQVIVNLEINRNKSDSIFSEEREYKTYLGREFVKAFEEVECAYVGGSEQTGLSVLLVSIATFIVRVL